MNAFLNENWAEMLNDLKPAIKEAFSAYFISISHEFFARVPFHKIFIV